MYDLNLKTIIRISDKNIPLEIIGVDDEVITKIKLDGNLFTINNGPEQQISSETPRIIVKKDEHKPLISEHFGQKLGQTIKKDEQKTISTVKKRNIKNRRNKNYSKKEDKILINLYENNTVTQIKNSGKLPGRSYKSIEQRIHRLIVLGLLKRKFVKIEDSAEKKDSAVNENPAEITYDDINFIDSVEKTTEILKNSDNKPVKGYTEHLQRTIKKIQERKKDFNKNLSEENKI